MNTTLLPPLTYLLNPSPSLLTPGERRTLTTEVSITSSLHVYNEVVAHPPARPGDRERLHGRKSYVIIAAATPLMTHTGGLFPPPYRRRNLNHGGIVILIYTEAALIGESRKFSLQRYM